MKSEAHIHHTMSRSALPYELRVNGFRISTHRSYAAAERAWERTTRDDAVITSELVEWLPPSYGQYRVLCDHQGC